MGCRSELVGIHCRSCHFKSCAYEKGIEFCSQCETYPCEALKDFQSKAPHRLDLWEDLDAARDMNIVEWTDRMKHKYECPKCKTINSSYDKNCCKCGYSPASSYFEKYQDTILAHLNKK